MLNWSKLSYQNPPKKFDFLVAEEFGQILRIVDRNELEIPNISKMHSLTLIDDKIFRKEQSCRECRVNTMCDECTLSSNSTPKSKMKLGSENDIDTDNAFDGVYDEDDEGKTDESDSDESDSSDEESEIQPGDIVWGLLGRIWYPGRVARLNEVPENLKHKFSCISTSVIVNWYGDNMYSAVKRVEQLGETQLDARKASRSNEMQKLYNMALSDL